MCIFFQACSLYENFFNWFLGVCHQCHYVNDICYLPEAEICNRFVECHRNGDQVRAFEKECAIGNFWNPETLACQKSVYVNCAAGKGYAYVIYFYLLNNLAS